MAKVKLSHYVALLDDLLANQTSAVQQERFADFLFLLAHNQQLDDVDEILRLYALLQDNKNHRLTVTVHHQTPPTTAQLKNIEKFLCQQHQVDTVDLQLVADGPGPGLIIDTLDTRYDLSLARQVADFRQQLVNQNN